MRSLRRKFRASAHEYNHLRLYMGIDGKMPAERLAELRITGVLKSAWLSQELGSHKRRVGNYLVRSGFVNEILEPVCLRSLT